MRTPKPSIKNIIKSLFIGLVFCTLQLSLSLPMPPRYATRRSSRLSAKVKVTTYNVLSSHLAAPSWFPACNPEYLAPKFRFESLKKKLDEECESNAVICLQELSHTWAGPLHSFFANRGYHVVNALYGNRMNNYMGVALAVPLDKYDILDVNIQKVSDTKIMPRKPKLTSFQEVLRQIQGVFIKLAIFFKLYRPPFDVWDNVLYRHNQMVCARLQDKESGKSFVVGTYHMPCMFDKPAVMVTHTSLSAKHILRYAEQVSADDSSGERVVDPVIFCGDYNFKPGSSEYELITKGQLDEKHPDQPPAVPGDSWTTTLPTAFASAYATKLGTEPDFTNYAKVQQQPEFIDTLDYIFYSPKEGIEVESVRPLPHRSEVQGPLPNRDEPSDHILLSATFNLH